ncbi:pyridoxamine 5'-phosphate oxidase [Sinimarinibacterium sp. NLF-5-8]|uniref:pyridoxamine 5'-phosphate oxidase n=1 Tax=Sinimarinibacterium sp. NLF-5-8 TaxID=2698684 RepID=UPI00137C06C1|nr:pyridoxamine 5'-phosphate oxidase [Sinimarinibacterium sp. NLF-5-8]QHS10079.1 pyridoxamine 5'-phosphate oxidase [Sinimarinibacterium sp. NLF-5-8]
MPQYTKNPPLLESHVDPDPIRQFEHWFADAERAQLIDPNAMTLASVDANGQPSARIVLFKGLYQQQFTFYTNYQGRKGHELAQNPSVALVFWWGALERQIRIEGQAQPLPRAVSAEYFHSRIRESQLGAIASRQSAVIESRDALDAHYAAVAAQYANGEQIPLPDHWGGYGVTAQRIEFWQGRLGRLHDRLRYTRAPGGWTLERLEP